jgi:putative endopeptidase
MCLLPLALAAQTDSSRVATPAKPESSQPAGASAPAPHGLDPANLDRTCKPCEEFYRFAAGGWMTRNPVPAAYPSWGTFNELLDRNQVILHQILDEATEARNATPGSVEQKIGDFYGSCMATEKIEAEGIQPLEPELTRIAKIDDLASLEAEVARLHGFGVRPMFGFRAVQDFKNSSQVIGGAFQGGLGLPDRDYYSKTDEKSKQIREQYLQHVARIFQLLGDPAEAAAAEAQAVMAIETKLAEASMTRVERRDPDKTYHKMNTEQLAALTPHLPWTAYFREVGFPGIDQVNVAQPEFFKQLDQQLTAVPMADWKTYLRWHLIHGAAPALSSKFEEEDFSFYGKALTGAKELQPRWKRCVESTDRHLGEALGQKYVERAFPPEAKARALKMVHNLIAALRADLATLPWMGPETRKQALGKLDAFTVKVGYPDKWRDYSAFRVTRGPYLTNFFQGNLFETRRELGQIGKPVDRTEWGMTPPTVNAYYSASMNEIVFPAGILQPPFYDPQADDAYNYGGIGAVIGHEMTHGFDDEGRKFDAQGNLKDWWTAEDAKNFEQRSSCVAKQFDSYVVEGDLHENGKLVLGESIADLGGLTISHAAFQTTPEAKEGKETDGFTPEQRFFLAWAQIWAANNRPEFVRMMVNVNPHPLGRFRAIAPPSNMPAFAKAFDCQAGDPMVRPSEARCEIW